MMVYKDYIYDPRKDYFGANGSWISKFTPDYPPCLDKSSPNIRALIKERYNRQAAFPHDVEYTGKKRHWFGKMLDYIDRLKADRAFKHSLDETIRLYEEYLSPNQRKDCYDFNKKAYVAIRVSGWIFFRTSDTLD